MKVCVKNGEFSAIRLWIASCDKFLIAEGVTGSEIHHTLGNVNGAPYPWPKALYTQIRHKRDAYALRCLHAACKRRMGLINFLRTWGEQRIPGAWKEYPAYPVLFVFAEKTDKFRFVANGMRTFRGWCGTGFQRHPYIRAFGLWTVREPFGALIYTRLNTWFRWSTFHNGRRSAEHGCQVLR